MTNKDIFTTATLNEIFAEVTRRAQEGYTVADGPTYSEGTYTVRFKHKNGLVEAQPEVVTPMKPDMPSPATEMPAPMPPLHPEDAVVEFDEAERADPATEMPAPTPIKHTETPKTRGPKPKKSPEA